jgi:quinol monooxygenase YgiN
MPELQVIARHRMRPGMQDQVLPLLPQLVEAARQEPGNLAFAVYRQLDDELNYVLLERYASREAFEEHRQTQHFKDIILDQIVPRLESRTIECFDVVAGGSAQD